MCSRIGRLKSLLKIPNSRPYYNTKLLGPMYYRTLGIREEIEALAPDNKHWACRGPRALAAAVNFVLNNEVIAVPTELMYNLACLINKDAIRRVYEIKNQDTNDLLPLCLGNVRHIAKWCFVDHLPKNLLENVLPGPTTYILPRRSTLDPIFNKGHSTVAICVPVSKFVRHLATLVGPIVLTSINPDNENGIKEAKDFSELWPKLDGIFYELTMYKTKYHSVSTVIDLSEPGRFRIVREGHATNAMRAYLGRMGLKCSI